MNEITFTLVLLFLLVLVVRGVYRLGYYAGKSEGYKSAYDSVNFLPYTAKED